MASELKRKRGPVDVLDPPRRPKTVKTKDREPKRRQTALEAALCPPPNIKQLVQVNGNYVKVKNEQGVVDSIAVEERKKSRKEAKRKQHEEAKQKNAQKTIKSLKNDANIWRLSEPVAGRMIDADPVFSKDEKYAKSSPPPHPEECC